MRRPLLAELRHRLSPQGDVVSNRGREKTIAVFGEPLTPQQVVTRICDDVRQRGIAAVLEYNRKIDLADMAAADLRVPSATLEAAHAAAAPEFLAAVRHIRDNIVAFQQAILHENVVVNRPGGATLEHQYLPLKRVGICVPGGAAAYPSSVFMTAVPALVAGVSEIAVVAPPTNLGAYNPDVLATCHELGITEVYRVGGAQAVASLAYGVAGIEAVDKIVGPGNLFVALAKKLVYGEVDIDSIAGPSEVVVVADHTTSPEFCAADLLAQAEHAPGASILITWHEATLTAVAAAMEVQLKGLSRSALTRQSLEEFGTFILAEDAAEACELVNRIAPEHLHIATENARELSAAISQRRGHIPGPLHAGGPG